MKVMDVRPLCATSWQISSVDLRLRPFPSLVSELVKLVKQDWGNGPTDDGDGDGHCVGQNESQNLDKAVGFEQFLCSKWSCCCPELELDLDLELVGNLTPNSEL